jgi:hypothetical protein
VKVERRLLPSGKRISRATYILFKHTLTDGKPLQLVVRDNGGLIKICSISYGDTTSFPMSYTNFSWGDGEKKHVLKKLVSYSERSGRGSFFNFIDAQVTTSILKEMKNAVVFSVESGGVYSTPLLYQTHKHWQEWLEAIDAAEKLMRGW